MKNYLLVGVCFLWITGTAFAQGNTSNVNQTGTNTATVTQDGKKNASVVTQDGTNTATVDQKGAATYGVKNVSDVYG